MVEEWRAVGVFEMIMMNAFHNGEPNKNRRGAGLVAHRA